MANSTVRDPREDHLLTPDNCALIIIDFQPVRVAAVASINRRALMANVLVVARTAMLYGLPVVLSSINVGAGGNAPTMLELVGVLHGVMPIDRTSINAWEDTHFVEAVKATKRTKLIMAALWTEASLTFPALDAMREGYEVYPVVDAIGGTSGEAHRAGLERVIQAGAHPVTWTSLLCELQRDWNRGETASSFARLMSAVTGP